MHLLERSVVGHRHLQTIFYFLYLLGVNGCNKQQEAGQR